MKFEIFEIVYFKFELNVFSVRSQMIITNYKFQSSHLHILQPNLPLQQYFYSHSVVQTYLYRYFRFQFSPPCDIFSKIKSDPYPRWENLQFQFPELLCYYCLQIDEMSSLSRTQSLIYVNNNCDTVSYIIKSALLLKDKGLIIMMESHHS
jgi:hypothetical protein